MTRKRQRLWLVLGGMTSLGIAAALVLSAFSDNLVFFYSPSQLAADHRAASRMVRVGGLVEMNSVLRQDAGREIRFKVTDGAHDLPVVYQGVPPDLFREGQGVVAEGRLDQSGVLRADTILAKHDERYMPKEVVDALKASGRWQDGAPAAAAAATPALEHQISQIR